MLLIYAVSNVCFQTKTSETFIWYEQRLFGVNNSPSAPRIAIRERNQWYFAVVLYRWGKSKLQLTSMGYQKLPVAAIRSGKRGNITLAVPGHDPPFEITIFNDIYVFHRPGGLYWEKPVPEVSSTARWLP